MEIDVTTIATNHCYCLTTEVDYNMLTCCECKKRFHPLCLKTGRPSPLACDVYFNFTCQSCSNTGVEIVKRKKLQWTLVVMLALYNLQLKGGGKCGYFRWREHICMFIEKNWLAIFGDNRKKSATWHGTVAGCLSTGANRFFVSGFDVLKETGWWSLKSSKLPSLEELDSLALSFKSNRKRPAEGESPTVVEGSRKKSQNVVEAAVALKEKKTSVVSETLPSKSKKKRDSKQKSTDIPDFPYNHKLKIVIKKEPEPAPVCNFSTWIKEPKLEFDLNIGEVPSNIFDMGNSPEEQEIFESLPDDVLTDMNLANSPAPQLTIKQEFESDEENSNSSKTVSVTKKFHPDTGRKKKAVTKDESPVKDTTMFESKFTLMNAYEEEQLLQQLENHPSDMNERPELRRLYRKLKVRKLKREHKLPVFDIDAEMRHYRGMDPPDYLDQPSVAKLAAPMPSFNAVLDRYHTSQHSFRAKTSHRSSFITRLMGQDDDDQLATVSPYTERELLPFIFRDNKTKPLKLQLLEELLAYTHRGDPDWSPPKQSSIDYCYVRPQHIPTVNAMCHEFFWPGIDMSESLQYPDFSCIALYKKVIIGFAFMVPDVKYHEAYITFIFCHPEWRRAGIATFMLYHLIQTCMGKDVTLHVSATSSAVFLYQKFGFKIEELIHDFYDKYLPPDSKECRHALFLRLNR